MTSTFIAMQFALVKQHFDMLIVNEAWHLPELEAGMPFVLLGSNRWPTIVLVGTSYEPAKHIAVCRDTDHCDTSPGALS